MGGSVSLLLGGWLLHVLRCLAKFVEMVVIQPLIAHGSVPALILGRSVLLGDVLFPAWYRDCAVTEPATDCCHVSQLSYFYTVFDFWSL